MRKEYIEKKKKVDIKVEKNVFLKMSLILHVFATLQHIY